MQETWVRSLGQEDPLGKEMATHSSILAWRILWAEEPGRLQSTGSQRIGHDWATLLWHFLFYVKPLAICYLRVKKLFPNDRVFIKVKYLSRGVILSDLYPAFFFLNIPTDALIFQIRILLKGTVKHHPPSMPIRTVIVVIGYEIQAINLIMNLDTGHLKHCFLSKSV